MNSSQRFLQIINECMNKHFEYGPRSSKIVDHLHEFILNELKPFIPFNMEIKTEINIPSFNDSGRKKCDIVILNKSNKTPEYIFPVKFIRSNYSQNKNNYFENLAGECLLLKTKNPDLKIIPINVIFNKVPYLTKTKKIKKFENTCYSRTFKIYDEFCKNKYSPFTKCLNYVIDVEHPNLINNEYNTVNIINFSNDTPFYNWDKILLG
jgi:hypothetical protein